MPLSRKKRQRSTAALSAIQDLMAHPLMMDESAVVARLEFARAVGQRGELPTGSSIVARSLSDRVQIVGGVAMIPIQGAIWPTANFWTKYYGDTACNELVNAIASAAGDNRVSRILLVTDSPGGSVFGLDEASTQIHALRDRKPIECFVAGLCASAAYYLGSSASKIHATPSSSIGSIGTILQHWDWSGYLEDFGVKITPIHFGKHKDDGSPTRPLDAQGRQTLQDWVNDYGDQFVAAVARNRGVTPEIVQSKFGQGKVFIASRSLEIGLIDSVTTLDQLVGANQAPAEDTTDQRGADAIVGDSGSTILNGTTSAPLSTTIGIGPLDMTPAAPILASPISQPATGSAQVGAANSPTGPTTKGNSVNPRIKSLLYALELIDSVDASDETCRSALSAYCRGRGVDVPKDDAAIVSLLTSKSTTTEQPADNVTAAHQREQGEAKAMTAAEFQAKRDQVASIASLVNAGRSTPLIDSATVEKACAAFCAGDKDLAAIQAEWQKAVAEDKESATIAVRVTGQGTERLAEDATAMMLDRLGLANAEDRQRDWSAIAGAGLLEIAEAFAGAQGHRLEGITREERAEAALAMNPMKSRVPSIHAGSGSFNRVGDFPNLLSNLAGKILDRSTELAPVTYGRWTNRMMDIPNFQPKTVLGAASFTQMDEVMDDEHFKQLAMSEELKGWLSVSRYANKVGLTPVMVANDDLDAFVQMLQSMGYAHENTLNSLCVELITANAALADGLALFHSTHGNLISSGSGAPSAAQAKLMRVAHRKQAGIGTTKRINSEPRLVLVPPDLEDEAKQTYYDFSMLKEVKVGTTDATVNVHRGTVTDVVVEADLTDYSTQQWYTLDPMYRTIVHAFQTGYGRGGRRTTWYENGNGTRYVSLEGRFGAAAVGFRGIVRNNG